MLGSSLELADTSVETWRRPPAFHEGSPDGLEVSGTVVAADELDALIRFCAVVSPMLDKAAWREATARLETQVVRLDSADCSEVLHEKVAA